MKVLESDPTIGYFDNIIFFNVKFREKTAVNIFLYILFLQKKCSYGLIRMV